MQKVLSVINIAKIKLKDPKKTKKGIKDQGITLKLYIIGLKLFRYCSKYKNITKIVIEKKKNYFKASYK